MKALIVISAFCLFLMSIVLFLAAKGFDAGYEVGRRENNKWWVAEKSTAFETRQIVNRRYTRKFNHI
jgi:hypothetical protein